MDSFGYFVMGLFLVLIGGVVSTQLPRSRSPKERAAVIVGMIVTNLGALVVNIYAMHLVGISDWFYGLLVFGIEYGLLRGIVWVLPAIDEIFGG